MTNSKTLLLLSGAVSVVALCFACSSDDSNGSGTETPTTDAGADTGAPSDTDASSAVDAAPTPTTATQTGVVKAFVSGEAVADAKLTAGDATTTSGADGSYSFTYKRGEAVSVTLEKTGYYKTIEPEWILNGNALRNISLMTSDDTGALFTELLEGNPKSPAADPGKGFVIVFVVGLDNCTDYGDATVTISDPGATGRYFGAGGLPDTAVTKTVNGAVPAIAFYNVTPGNVTLDITHPSCTKKAFPVDFEFDDGKGPIRFTGNTKVEAGKSISNAFLFLTK